MRGAGKTAMMAQMLACSIQQKPEGKGVILKACGCQLAFSISEVKERGQKLVDAILDGMQNHVCPTKNARQLP